MVLTDQMLLRALIDTVGALAYRLTGEYPMVCLEDEDGNVLHVTLGVGGVQWFKDPSDATCCIHTERWFQNKAAQGGESRPAEVKAQAD